MKNPIYYYDAESAKKFEAAHEYRFYATEENQPLYIQDRRPPEGYPSFLPESHNNGQQSKAN